MPGHHHQCTASLRRVQEHSASLDLTTESRQKVTWAIKIAKIYGSGIKVVSGIWGKNDPAVYNRLKFLAEQVKQFIEKEGIRCTAEFVLDIENEKMLIPSLLSYAENKVTLISS